MMNSLPIEKKIPGAPMITRKIGRMTFTRSLLDIVASINILHKVVFFRHHVGELQPFLVELCFTDWSVRKPHDIVEDMIVRIEDCYFPVDFSVVDIEITKELSQALIILGRPFLATAKPITNWGKGEVIIKVREHIVKVDINKLMNYPLWVFEDLGAIDLCDDEELPLVELTLELKPLPSSLKYTFLDTQQEKPVIISSQLDQEKEKWLLYILRWLDPSVLQIH